MSDDTTTFHLQMSVTFSRSELADDAPAGVDLAAALRASVEAARARQRERDNEPCPKCGGDRLRTDFTSSGRCHAERADA